MVAYKSVHRGGGLGSIVVAPRPPQLTQRIGWSTYYYVGFNVGGVEIALTPQGDQKGRTAPVAHVLVADLDAALAEVQEAGATLASEPKDVGGALIATVTDPDATTLGLIQGS